MTLKPFYCSPLLMVTCTILISVDYALGNIPVPDKLQDSLSRAKKEINAIRISTPPRIDGVMNEPFWKDCPVARDFLQYSPNNGKQPSYPSVVRFAYDDQAVYILAMMYDPFPDSICKELGRRDQVELLNTDYISFDILPYNDALNMFEFKVTPANLQNDCKYSAIGQDITWDAVWQSAASISDSGWIAEVKIPFSALRFPRIEEQVWGINMWRNFHRKQEYSTWSYIDNSVQDIFKYYGTLKGISHIKPPLRLSFTPYIAGYAEKNPDNKNIQYLFRGGMDLRFGITQSYTLDMMLIPDFGQVQADDKILNLSPFEVKYDEKRQFFTEATELFSKCGIFYSRRIGNIPKHYNAPYDSLKEHEVVAENPMETKIINATKISGRNSKGLGFGFFNAMTTNTYGELFDTLTGKSHRIKTQPFTNYNVLVADQNLKNNSYITLINTNYWTPDDRYVADVAGVETRLCNKTSTFAFFGRTNISQKYQGGLKPDVGYYYNLKISRPRGRFQYQLGREAMNDRYDPNDMGFLLSNNEARNTLVGSWFIFEPVWTILNAETDLQVVYATVNNDNSFKNLQFTLMNQTQFRNFLINVVTADIDPLGYYDYYEPRTWGWVYKKPLNYDVIWKFATDMRNPFRVHNTIGFWGSPGDKGYSYWIEFIPRFRFSDRFTVSLTAYYQKSPNNYGWVNTILDSLQKPTITFGRRDLTTWNNILAATFIFNTKASISLRARHYWSQVRCYDFYTLNRDGYLDHSSYQANHDVNFNAFTVDLQFVWYFAPGSELSIVWKNNITTQGQELEPAYLHDLQNTLSSPQSNSFSVKVLYYLDYQNLKKVFTKHS